MSKTGFTFEREAPHRDAIRQVITALNERGYGPVAELIVDGHRPDLEIQEALIEVKTGSPNGTIELNSLDTCRRIQILEQRRIYIVHVQGAQMYVHTPDSITSAISGGPRRHSGNGSHDDWYLCDVRRNPGTPFDAFFPPKWNT